MVITLEQYEKIKESLPVQRWAKNGALDRIFEKLQLEQIVTHQDRSVLARFNHRQGTPGWDRGIKLKKTGHKPLASHAADGPPRFIWLPRMPAYGP